MTAAPTARGRALLDWVAARRDGLVDFLVELAAMESPSDDPASQAAPQAILREAFEELGYRVRHLPGRHTGGHLWMVPRQRERGRPGQLLLGHSDTVWPVGTLARMPLEVADGVVRGPGTFDMKGGLTQMVYALRALRDLDLEPPATPVVFINTDEEIGSPESQRWVAAVARRVCRAFVLEPARGPRGLIKTARKGVANYTLTVNGKAAHAGLDPTGGASAIEALARLVPRVHALADLDRGRSVNVGVVRGGTRPNVIAAEAVAELDVRVATTVDFEEVDRALRALSTDVPGTSLTLDGGLRAPPLERTPRNRRLWDAARHAGRAVGLDLEETMVGGGSDGNTASRYTATLDGLGAVGDGAHALDEHLRVDPLIQRTALLAELLLLPVEGA